MIVDGWIGKKPRVALCTTTINIPTVLRLYRAYGPDVAFFVAGDLKTPKACEELCESLPGVNYLSPDWQKSLGYKCSELLGWDCIARRNIATLVALAWGAEIIVLTDDDNLPMNEFYFTDHVNALTKPHCGIKASSTSGWFDVGTLLYDDGDNCAVPHRGFPHNVNGHGTFQSVVDAKVGVNAGVCMGDPDCSATTRIARSPVVHHASCLLDSGIVVDNRTKTVFNSQNTAFIRELAPAMFMMPGVGRYDDLYASLICQRVMIERDLHVKFSRPFVWQERNEHDLIKDLRAEIDGMENIEKFAQSLNTMSIANLPVIDALRIIYAFDDILPTKAVTAAHAFLDDCEKVMG